MAYSDFDLRKVLTDFGLRDQSEVGLFDSVLPLSPGAVLTEWLSEYGSYANAVNSEKARSEYLITPIFAEARRLAGRTFRVMPGVSFDVDKSKGLNGICDYLVTKAEGGYFVRGPLVAVVEGKKGNVTESTSLGQCAAEMVAIRQFNDREQTPRPVIYGCVTSGNMWLFLKLEGDTLFIDKTVYYVSDVARLLGFSFTSPATNRSARSSEEWQWRTVTSILRRLLTTLRSYRTRGPTCSRASRL